MMAHQQMVLERLKAELAFVESGGYRDRPELRWRAPYIFEDSPSCPNNSDSARPHLCIDCWLREFVPVDMKDEQVPCRFISLTRSGVTVDSLYRFGTAKETEEALCGWLRERIREIEYTQSQAEALKFGTSTSCLNPVTEDIGGKNTLK